MQIAMVRQGKQEILFLLLTLRPVSVFYNYIRWLNNADMQDCSAIPEH